MGRADRYTPEPLHTDADGVPMLLDVVVAGDTLKRADYRLVPDASAGNASQDTEAYLQGRITQAVRAALPRTMEDTVRRRLPEVLRRESRRHRRE